VTPGVGQAHAFNKERQSSETVSSLEKWLLGARFSRELFADGSDDTDFSHAPEHVGSDIGTARVVAKDSLSSSSLPSGVVGPVLIVT